MSNELVLQNDLSLSQMGKTFAASGYFQDATQAVQAVVKIQAGQELGIPPVASMTTIHIIKGKPSLGAQAIAGLLKKSEKYDYRVREISDSICTIEFFQNMSGKYESIGKTSFTKEDAQKAGTQNMGKFPRNMLFARCITNGVKWFCPDLIICGAYTPEELSGGDFQTNENSEPIYTEAEVIEEIPQEKIDKLMELAEILGVTDQFKNSWIGKNENWIDSKIAKAEKIIAEKEIEINTPADEPENDEEPVNFPDKFTKTKLYELVQKTTKNYYNAPKHMENAIFGTDDVEYPKTDDKAGWIALYNAAVNHCVGYMPPKIRI